MAGAKRDDYDKYAMEIEAIVMSFRLLKCSPAKV